MRFGLSFLPDASPESQAPADYFTDAFALARLADQAGLDYVKMTGHFLHPYGGYAPNPLLFLAAVAAQTHAIRLITGCMPPVFGHPLVLASNIAMADAISRGRLEVGFAHAYLPQEFRTFHIPVDDSLPMFEATIAAVDRLLTEEHVSERTPFFSFADATVLPRSTQSPRPPFWIAAVQTAASFRRIGELGHGLLITPTGTDFDVENIEVYREAFALHHPAGQPRVMGTMPLVVAETDQAARQLADPYLDRHLGVWSEALRTRNHGLSAKGLRANGTAIVGSPEHVIDQIGTFAARTGVDGMLWHVDFGGFGGTDGRRSTEMFIDKVRPYFTSGSAVAGLNLAGAHR